MTESFDRVRTVLTVTEEKALKALVPAFRGEQTTVARIADGGGFTRSTFINVLRLLKVAGLVQTQSMGQKGTHIKVLWDGLPDAIEAMASWRV